MIFRALDSDGDWTFGKGTSGFLTGRDALAVNLATRTREWKGECFFALQDGIDWNNYFDIRTKTLLDAELQRNWLKSYGVIRIYSYASTLDPVTRQLTVQATVATIYGNLPINEVF